MPINSSTIGAASVLKLHDDISVTLDDRQELVQIDGGVTVLDHGRIAAGDRHRIKVTLTPAAYATVANYWAARTLANVALPGLSLTNRRVVVRSVAYSRRFEGHVDAEIELWGA